LPATVEASAEGGLFPGAGDACRRSGGPLEQGPGFPGDDLTVRRFRDVDLEGRPLLHHLALDDLPDAVGEAAQEGVVAGVDEHFERARQDEIAGHDADPVAVQDAGGGDAAAHGGVIQHVVVQEGGGVDELGGQGDGVDRLDPPFGDGVAEKPAEEGPDAFGAAGTDELVDGARDGFFGPDEAAFESLLQPGDLGGEVGADF
jgi:hypothetical protein